MHMLNPEPYKTSEPVRPRIRRGTVLKLVIVIICGILVMTSIKTVSLIYNTETETGFKDQIQLQAYIELIRVKNEEKEVSSKQFIQNQGRQIANLLGSGEKRLIITNKHELDSLYQKMLSDATQLKGNEKATTTNPWHRWFELLIVGL